MFSKYNAHYYQHISAIFTDYGSKQAATTGVVPISQVKFDNRQELLWSGNILGHTTSYYGDQLTKYTSFDVGYNDPVLQISTVNEGVLFLTRDELKMRTRGGAPIFSYKSPQFKSMMCMAQLRNEAHHVFGGADQWLTILDINRQTVIQRQYLEEEESGCCLVKTHPRFVCTADTAGRITLRTTNNLRVEYSFNTHSGPISDFDIHGNYLITCGYSAAHQRPDKCIMVYDLRTGKFVKPILTYHQSTLLKFIPAFTSKFCVVEGWTGQYQIIDVSATAGEVTASYNFQIPLNQDTSITAMDVSTSGQALAFGDNTGVLYLQGSNSEVVYNQNSDEIKFADAVSMIPPIPPHDNITPLSAIPNAYSSISGNDNLASDSLLPYDKRNYYNISVGNKTILESTTQRGDVGYVPNPYKKDGALSYIRGTVGVVGVTKLNKLGEEVEEPIESTDTASKQL